MPIISEENSSLIQPDEDCTIWRFMSIPKYLSLISTRKLIFAQIEELQNRDPKEGLFTSLQVLEAEHNDPMAEILLDINSRIASPKGAKLALKDLTPWNEYLEIVNSTNKYIQYVNCWNMSPHEPAQLWSVYASEQDGIAIKSSFSRLTESLKGSDKKIRSGKINYLNYSNEKISLLESFAPIFTKRIEFEHEKEMRLCISDMTPNVEKRDESGKIVSTEIDFLKKPKIIQQSCNIGTLIEEVRIAPFSTEWSSKAIEEVTRKFGLDFPIEKSCLV